MGNSNYFLSFEGVNKYITIQQEQETSATAQKWAGQFIRTLVCPECHGQRLNREALHYLLNGKNIADLSGMDISELYEWLNDLNKHLSAKQKAIAKEILKEICSRLRFLLDVGLDYLALNRASVSLSGGESQQKPEP